MQLFSEGTVVRLRTGGQRDEGLLAHDARERTGRYRFGKLLLRTQGTSCF